jgi:hypothetical protein
MCLSWAACQSVLSFSSDGRHENTDCAARHTFLAASLDSGTALYFSISSREVPYAPSRTLFQCVCTQHRNRIGRLTAAMILSGSAVHLKGLDSTLCSSRNRLMAAWRSPTDLKTPCFNRRLVRMAKKPSIALSHEHEVGLKWNVQARGGN